MYCTHFKKYRRKHIPFNCLVRLLVLHQDAHRSVFYIHYTVKQQRSQYIYIFSTMLYICSSFTSWIQLDINVTCVRNVLHLTVRFTRYILLCQHSVSRRAGGYGEQKGIRLGIIYQGNVWIVPDVGCTSLLVELYHRLYTYGVNTSFRA